MANALTDLLGEDRDVSGFQPGGDTVHNECVRAVLGQIQVEETGELERRKRWCLEGNPYPLIAYYWPFLMILNVDEEKYFKGEIGNEENPCLRIDDWQRDEILGQLFREEIYDIAVKGSTKPGKGASIAIGVNLWFEVFDPCKIILTSSSYEHAKDNIFGEVSKWRRQMQGVIKGKLLGTGISDHDQHYLTVSNPGADEGFSGQHGPATLFVFDEASALIKARYDDAQKQAKKVVAIGNPRHLSGQFYTLFEDLKGDEKNRCQDVPGPMGLRRCVTIGGADCANVRFKRLEKPVSPVGGIEIDGTFYPHGQRIPVTDWEKVQPLIPQQVDYARYMAIKTDPDPRHADVFADGKFPEEDPDKQVIMRSHLRSHIKAHAAFGDTIDVTAFGFDVARSISGDQSVLTYGGPRGIRRQDCWRWNDTVYHAMRILEIAESLGIDLTTNERFKGERTIYDRVPVCVDMDGLGAGVGDLLKAKGVWVIEFHGSMRAPVKPEKYGNWRAEGYALIGRRVDPKDNWGDQPYCIPDDPELHEDLCTPEKMPMGGDALRFKLQPKEVVAKKLGRSPDKGDSAMYFDVARRAYETDDQAYRAAARRSVIIHVPGDDRPKRGARDEEQTIRPPITPEEVKDWAAGLKVRRPKNE